jgi:hypothetical protein
MGTLKCQKLNKIWANKNKNLKQNKKSSKQLKIKSLKEFQREVFVSMNVSVFWHRDKDRIYILK